MTATQLNELSDDNLYIAAMEVRIAKRRIAEGTANEALAHDLDRALRVIENTHEALRALYIATGNTDVFDILHPKKN